GAQRATRPGCARMGPDMTSWWTRLLRGGVSATAEAPNARTWSDIRLTLERILLENIVPFWYPRALDQEHGGYLVDFDIQGQPQGPKNKTLVSQAGTLWFFAYLARSPYGKPEHLEAARHGYDFLRDRLWDGEFGGFFWEVDP